MLAGDEKHSEESEVGLLVEKSGSTQINFDLEPEEAGMQNVGHTGPMMEMVDFIQLWGSQELDQETSQKTVLHTTSLFLLCGFISNSRNQSFVDTRR